MKKDYEPTKEQRAMIAAAIDTAIMPLIRQVLVKKIGQAAVFMKEEIDARYQPLTDEQINDIWEKKVPFIDDESDWYVIFAREIERHVRGDHAG